MTSLDEVRAAFAHGWAASGGPLTERVKAVCAHHLTHADLDDPDLIEATIDVGHLEGVWAIVHERRERLHARHEAAVRAVWRSIVAELPTADAVRRYRAALGIHEDDTDDKARRKAAAAGAAAWLLAHARQSPQEQALLDALDEAVREGMAEGATTAVLLAAEQAGRTGDPDLIYAARLAEAAVPEGLAQQVETAILSGASSDTARVLAKPDPADVTADEQMAELDAELDSDNGAASLLTDAAVGRGFSAGMLAMWLRLGGSTVSWVTMGDGRVCLQCEDLESNSPYSALDAPQPPAHPRCRCVLVSDDNAWPGGILDGLLGG